MMYDYLSMVILSDTGVSFTVWRLEVFARLRNISFWLIVKSGKYIMHITIEIDTSVSVSFGPVACAFGD